MLKTDLITALETVDPARSSLLIVPLLTHFWFLEDRVMAFNDHIAISVKFDSGYFGAVPGVLLTILKAAGGVKEISIEDGEDDELVLKAGRSKSTMKVLDAEACAKVFRMPKDKTYPIEFASLKDFRAKLEHCLRSVGTDTSKPDQMGVTITPYDGKYIRLYSTDDVSMTAAEVLVDKMPKFERPVLSTAFVRQFLRLTVGVKDVDLTITDDYAIAFIGDEITLFGKLIESRRPLDYKSILEQHAPSEIVDSAIPFPPIGNMINRAMVVAGTGVDEVSTLITIADGQITFLTQSKLAEVEDHAKIDKHKALSLTVPIRYLRYGYDELPENTKIMFTDKAIVMASPSKLGGLIYMIAPRGGK